MGFTSCLIASQSRREASRNVLRIRWMMHVWTVLSGHTLPTTSGSPFRPSQTTKKVSLTPRLRRSVRTLIQNFAPSPPVPAHSPRTSFSPPKVTPMAA
jgi:hypothetical protein